MKAGEEQYKQFITIAEASAILPKGAYELSLTWDDAVRVFIDEKLLIDEWKPAKHKSDTSPNRKIIIDFNGNYHFKVEHLELGGFANLSLKLKPVK